jgi:ATP-dependent Lhr-like helicase
MELFARTLLLRYGVVFRRLLERETFNISWYELGRIYRRLEARGEIRGGHFVSGVSGEQFALPEAIGSLRSQRKAGASGELVTISGADPLNLVGILSPGARVSAVSSNRIMFRDGVPVAALESGQIIALETPGEPLDSATERSLRVAKLPAGLRPYYAR